MKIISGLICFLFLMAAVAQADQDTFPEFDGSRLQQSAPEGLTSQGGHHGPPPEAFKACEGKTDGARAQFTRPDGEIITGTCRNAAEGIVLRPDRPPGDSRDGRRGPPPEAYAACEGKTVGSTAQFVNPRGETVTGKCESEAGRMVLRPDFHPVQNAQ